jgi:hypothetical protein
MSQNLYKKSGSSERYFIMNIIQNNPRGILRACYANLLIVLSAVKQEYLFEVIYHIPLDVLGGVKSFRSPLRYRKDKKSVGAKSDEGGGG